MMVSGAGIGADFGVERRFEPGNPAAEPYYHVGDDVIRANAQPRPGDLQRQMPVPEMPGNPQQVCRTARLDLEDRLGGGADTEIPAAASSRPSPSTR